MRVDFKVFKYLLLFPFLLKAQDSPTVCLNQGTCFKGSWIEPEIATFQGIRFAEPPVGENRFKPPIAIKQNDLGTIEARSAKIKRSQTSYQQITLIYFKKSHLEILQASEVL